MKEKGVDIFNAEEPYFNDICIKYTKEGQDKISIYSLINKLNQGNPPYTDNMVKDYIF